MSIIEFKISKNLVNSLPHPEPAKKVVPDWYKRMPTIMDKPNNKKKLPWARENFNRDPARMQLTMKACVPILDCITSGYIMKLPYDLLVTNSYTDDGKKMFSFDWNSSMDTSDFPEKIHTHSIDQIKNSPLESKATLNRIWKFNIPWRIHTKPGYSVYVTHPGYRYDLPFETLPGVVDTDGHHEINYPFLWKSDEEQLILKKGTPVAQIFPFKRIDWNHKISEESSEEDINYKINFASRLGFWYRDLVHKKKRYR
tara:strand:+ start:242 stop:1006 length:765 start_codon:yes stop_codon:yes gene_type:complete